MVEETHIEIMRAIGRLEGKVEEGFRSTNGHLGTLNGKVADHERRLGILDVSDGQQNLKFGIIATVVGFVSSVLVTLGFTMFGVNK